MKGRYSKKQERRVAFRSWRRHIGKIKKIHFEESRKRINVSETDYEDDFYCKEILSGRTPVKTVLETDMVLAFYHTKPYWPVHIVVIPKKHIASILVFEESDHPLLLELFSVMREVAAKVIKEYGSCRILTNLGNYQDSKHLHWHISHGEPRKSF